MVTIDTHNLTKRYGQKILFHNLSYRFESGNIYGIAGRNGSGKSTFLKILIGYTTPNEGEINYFDDSYIIIHKEQIALRSSFIAPYIDIPVEFTFRELINFHFQIRKPIHANALEEIQSLFEFPQNTHIREYSSGMIQRVKLFLAFFTQSDMILLDEPTETLDEQGKELYSHLISSYSNSRLIIIASNKSSDFIQTKDIISIETNL